MDKTKPNVSRGRRKTLALWTVILACARAASAEPRAIDAERSTLIVRVYKAGIFSAFAHNHEIAASIAHGVVDVAARQVELDIEANSLRVRDPGASEKDRTEIQSTMLGPEVLDAARYPQIVFRSTSVEPAGGDSWRVAGNLTLHGQTRPVAVQVQEMGGHYLGSSRFKQTEFEIQPVKIAGGTVRVKDEVRIDFDIQLAR